MTVYPPLPCLAGLRVSPEDLFKMFTKLADENIAVSLPGYYCT